MSMTRAIIKRPDEEYGHMTNISTRLEALQKTVEGYIEMVKLDQDVMLIVDEEGRIKNNPQYNCTVKGIPLFGTIIAIGYGGEELTDLPITFKDWKTKYLIVR